MEQTCQFSHPVPINGDVCDQGHPLCAALQCAVADCDFVTQPVNVRWKSMAEKLLRIHVRKVHGSHDNINVIKVDAKQMVSEIIESIVDSIPDSQGCPGNKDSENLNKCQICSKFIKHDRILQHHMKWCHDIPINDEFKTPCPHCAKVYWSDEPWLLRLHVKIHHSLRGKTLPPIEGKTCPVCFKTFSNKTNVRRHILTEHEKSLRIKCPECEKSFASKTALNYHVKEHDANQDFDCEKCGETFPNLWTHRIHLRQHNKSEELKCSICELVLAGKKSLARHLQEIHFRTNFNTDKISVPVYAFECEHCDYKAKRKENLKIHMKNKHSDNKKNIPCEKCGKEFSNTQNMRRHAKNLHKM